MGSGMRVNHTRPPPSLNGWLENSMDLRLFEEYCWLPPSQPHVQYWRRGLPEGWQIAEFQMMRRRHDVVCSFLSLFENDHCDESQRPT